MHSQCIHRCLQCRILRKREILLDRGRKLLPVKPRQAVNHAVRREYHETLIVEIRKEHHNIIIQLFSCVVRILRFHHVSVGKGSLIAVMAVGDQHLFRFHLARNFFNHHSVGDHPKLVSDLLKRDIHGRRSRIQRRNNSVNMLCLIGIEAEDLAEIRIRCLKKFEAVLFCFRKRLLVGKHDPFVKFFQMAKRNKPLALNNGAGSRFERLNKRIDRRLDLTCQHTLLLPFVEGFRSRRIAVFFPAEDQSHDVVRVSFIQAILFFGRDHVIWRRNNRVDIYCALVIPDSSKRPYDWHRVLSINLMSLYFRFTICNFRLKNLEPRETRRPSSFHF